LNEQNTPQQTTPTPETSSGLQPNIAALLSYLFGFITGIIFLLISKDKYVRFHAFQSTFLSGALLVLSTLVGFAPFIGDAFSPLINLAGFILTIILMVKAYQGEKFKLPVIGDYAEKYSQA